jgi:flagella basal body P-ring formation protein FlgA
MLLRTLATAIRSIAVVLAVMSDTGFAHAEGGIVPVPTLTIYPGDVIKDEWLEDRPFPADTMGMGTGAVIDSRRALVGKVARRTLLPGKPIPANAVGERKIVTNGAMVKVVFQEGGLTIVTYAAALQAGTVGDVIPVRNIDSGLIVSGVVQPDGSVRVSDS